MNSFTIGRVQSLPVLTTTDNQCAFSNTFTTLRARGLSQHPADTATSVVSIDGEGVIAVGGLTGAINLLTEAGQLLTSNWTESVALDVGTTGQVLTANSSAANGIEWANFPTTPAGSAEYGVIIGTTPPNGSGTISIGYGAGSAQSDATNCIVIGTNSNCSSGTSNSILMGTGSFTGVSNEFYLPLIYHFNIPNLTTSADGTGKLMQWGGANAGWVQALGGTYNLVEKIDTAISNINSEITTLQSNNSVSTTGPFVPTFSSEVNCTAAAVNSGYSYYGEEFYNLYMLFTLDVTGSSISSFSVNISGIPGEYNTDFTPTAVVSVSGGFSLYHSVAWSFSTGAATISLSFTSSTTNEGYYVPDRTYTVSLHSWGILTQQP